MSCLQPNPNVTSQAGIDLPTTKTISQQLEDLQWSHFVASAKFEATIETLCTNANNSSVMEGSKLKEKHQEELRVLRKRQEEEWEELIENERVRLESVMKQVDEARRRLEREFEERRLEVEERIEERRRDAGAETIEELTGRRNEAVERTEGATEVTKEGSKVAEQARGAGGNKSLMVVEDDDEAMVWGATRSEWMIPEKPSEERSREVEAQNKERRRAGKAKRLLEERESFEWMVEQSHKRESTTPEALSNLPTTLDRLSSPSTEAVEERSLPQSPVELPPLSSPSTTPPTERQRQGHQELLDVASVITALEPHIPEDSITTSSDLKLKYTSNRPYQVSLSISSHSSWTRPNRTISKTFKSEERRW